MSGFYKPHVSIEINSRDRTKGSIENFVMYLSHQILFSQKPSKTYWMRLENIQIPHSFYQVEVPFNALQVVETGGDAPATFTLTVSPGNYTITELLTELETLYDAASADQDLTLTYDDVTNKVTFQYDGTGGTPATSILFDTIANGGTMNSLIGIGKANTDFITGQDVGLTVTGVGSGNAVVAPNCVDLHNVSTITVETDISSQNHYNRERQLHIGARVPILVDRNEVQYFSNHNGHLTKMNSKHPLSSIAFSLVDEFQNIKDLCGVDWGCEVAIYELTELHKMGHHNEHRP